MTLLDVGENLKQFLRTKPVVQKKVLFLFWYMQGPWQLLKKRFSLVPVKGYTWPLYQGSLGDEKITVLKIPAPGMPIMDILARELMHLGGEKFFLFGTAALLDQQYDINTRMLIYQAYTSNENSLTFANSITSKSVNGADKEFLEDLIFQKWMNEIEKKSRIWFLKGASWSTLSPYAFSQSELDSARENKCVCLDMESYALFKAACENRKKALAFFYPRDIFADSRWRSLALDWKKNSSKDDVKNPTEELVENVIFLLRNF